MKKYKRDIQAVQRDILSEASRSAFNSYNSTIRKNAKRDKKVRVVERVATGNACANCSSNAGLKTREQLKDIENHKFCRCYEVPRFENGEVDYSEKKREDLNASEQKAVDVLVSYGFKVKPLKEKEGQKNIDLLVDGTLVECKNISSETSAHTQMRRARKKFKHLNLEQCTYILTDVDNCLELDIYEKCVQKETRAGELTYYVVGSELRAFQK